jgi:hypothetical protein
MRFICQRLISSLRGRIYVCEHNGHMREVLQSAIQENTSLQKTEFIFLDNDIVDLNQDKIPEKVKFKLIHIYQIFDKKYFLSLD